jgi:hypothetical protein
MVEAQLLGFSMTPIWAQPCTTGNMATEQSGHIATNIQLDSRQSFESNDLKRTS